MAQVLKALDSLWNITFFKGHRSFIARLFLVGVSAYQSLASLQVVHNLVPLPIVPLEIYGPLTAYFGLKLEQFAAEHHP